MCLAGCASSKAPDLTPLPPIIKTVTVYRELPFGATMPCDEPAWSSADIVTDVDLAGLLSQYRVANTCNANKLLAIGDIYKSPAN